MEASIKNKTDKLKYLVYQKKKDLTEIVALFTNNRTKKVSEMNENEIENAINSLWNKNNLKSTIPKNKVKKTTIEKLEIVGVENHLPKNLIYLRGKTKLNQTDFGFMFGFTRATYGAYEEGRAEPKLKFLIQLSIYFNININDLLIKNIEEIDYIKSNQFIYQEAIQLYGSDIQILIAIEEMAELTKELIKFKRGEISIEKITSEMTDVKIMLEQLETVFENSKELSLEYATKIIRLSERIFQDQIAKNNQIPSNCRKTLASLCRDECVFYNENGDKNSHRSYCSKGFWRVGLDF